MSGFLLHEGAQVLCAHTPGQAEPTMTDQHVKVSGQKIVTQSSIYKISGCGLTGSNAPPCATAQWISAATHVKAGGLPVLLADSNATCVPTGTGLNIKSTQRRVKGT